MKKILIFNNDNMNSGATLSLVDWLNDIDFSKYNITLVLPKNIGNGITINNPNINIYKTRYYWCVKKMLRSKIYNILRYLAYKLINKVSLIRIVRHFRGIRFDYVISNSFVIDIGAKFALKNNYDHYWHIREFLEEDHYLTHYNSKKIMGLTEKSCAIYISNCVKEKHSKIYVFKKDIVIYDYVNCSNFYNVDRFKNDVTTICIVGQVKKSKGQQLLIKSLKHIKNNVKVFVCGTGNDLSFLMRYVDENNIKNVEFLGHVNDLSEIRKNCDINVVASISEAFGRVTIEAMMNSNLVIASKYAANIELIDEGYSGLFFDDYDEVCLAKTIDQAIDDRDKSNIIIKNAYNVVNSNNHSICSKLLAFLGDNDVR